IVPVSCPPWPGSITILPIFNPRARISERSPLSVGEASRTSGKDSAVLRWFLAEPLAGGARVRAVREGGLISGGSSLVTVTPSSSSFEASASTTIFLGTLGFAWLGEAFALPGNMTGGLVPADVESSASLSAILDRLGFRGSGRFKGAGWIGCGWLGRLL